MTPSKLRQLREALARGTKGPWSEDDGNIFSRPIADDRMTRIMNRLRGEKVERRHDEHDGLVAKCDQELPNFDNDAVLIVAAVNALDALLDVASAAQALQAARHQACATHREDHMEEEEQAADALDAALARLGDS